MPKSIERETKIPSAEWDPNAIKEGGKVVNVEPKKVPQKATSFKPTWG